MGDLALKLITLGIAYKVKILWHPFLVRAIIGFFFPIVFLTNPHVYSLNEVKC